MRKTICLLVLFISVSTFAQKIVLTKNGERVPLNAAAVGLSNVNNTADANKPVSTAQQTALDLKANIAAPTFTGDAKAVTPTAGDNDTSIATTAFVTAADNLKANIAAPTFTGDAKAVTPTAGDNDTSIATTAFVTAANTAASPASETASGIIEIATQAEATAMTSATLAVTPAYLPTAVRAVPLTGLSTATNAAVVQTDNILVGIGKLQKQITTNTTFTPNGSIGSTDVQAAIVEVRDEAVLKTGDIISGNLILNGPNKYLSVGSNSNTGNSTIIQFQHNGNYGAQMFTTTNGYNGGAEANFQLQVNQGGYGNRAWLSTPITANSQLYVNGELSCNNLVQRSDIRLKRDIKPIETSGFYQLNPVHYEKVIKATGEGSKDYWSKENGLIAQEVQKIFPDLVTEGATEEKYLELNYIGLIPIMIRVIQNQQKQIDELLKLVKQ
jgi:hypothetical protein